MPAFVAMSYVIDYYTGGLVIYATHHLALSSSVDTLERLSTSVTKRPRHLIATRCAMCVYPHNARTRVELYNLSIPGV